MTSWILQYLWAIILVIIVVVFQSEIRQVLDRMSPVRFFLGRPEALGRLVVEEVAHAGFELAQRRIGALIVFKRQDILEDYLKGGVPLRRAACAMKSFPSTSSPSLRPMMEPGHPGRPDHLHGVLPASFR